MTPMAAQSTGSDLTDRVLVFLFLLGLYLGIAVRLPGGIPVPAILAGMAGGLLLIKHAARIQERQAALFVVILVLYVLSIMSASDHSLLTERFKGFVQLTYSLVIGYAFFLTASRFQRHSLATIFLAFSLTILAGAGLETYTGFRAVSDQFRHWAFDFGVYDADIRDMTLYGRIRPKLFTSEPSLLMYGFTLFLFAWYVLSRFPFKTLIYVALLGAGFYLMRGPILFLGVILIPVYKVFLDSRIGPAGAGAINLPSALGTVVACTLLLAAAALAGSDLIQERLAAAASGQDPSFFGRIVAPPLTAAHILVREPFAGAGLTGWEFIERAVRQVYASTPWLTTDFSFTSAAHAITNYFWLHWIYLGLFWGILVLVAVSLFLRSLDTPSVAFCLIVWAVMGQAAGGYVTPRCWFTLILACTVAVVHERSRDWLTTPVPGKPPPPQSAPLREPPPLVAVWR